MTQNSEEDGWPAFIDLCRHFNTKQECEEFFDLFLTLEEKQDISKRFCILKALLQEKWTQREISQKLRVSISKITRGSNALKVIHTPFREALKKHML